jgi:esterase/lipase superfamily enzyme
MLHAGAKPVDYPALRELQTPEATATHVPIPHFRVVDLVAHSMGNRALVRALEKTPVSAAADLNLGEVVLAAPDIDADVFRDAVSEMKGKVRRYTLYGSANDNVLGLAKRLSRGPRAGDGGQDRKMTIA